jgi:RHS repeat-associated protein
MDTSGTAFSFTYDGRGNLTSDNRYLYRWDSFNRITNVVDTTYSTEHQELPHTATYLYDAEGRRVARLYEGQASGWVSERAVYDGAAVIEEYQFSAGATNILRRYFYDGDVNRPCVVQANINDNTSVEDSADEVYRLIGDERGSVLGIVDKAGNIVEKLHYNTTGLCKSYQADDSTATLDDNGYVSYRAQRVPFGYCGMYIEPFTGKGHTLYRDYDALHNMWLSRDPVAEQGGINLTGYCNGNAVDGVDPFGLWWWDADILEWGVGGMIGAHGADIGRASRAAGAEGYVGGATIAGDVLTFGKIKNLNQAANQYQGSEFQSARVSATVARSALLAAGGTAALQGALAGLGTLAAEGGAIGQAATIVRGGISAGLAVMSAESAGQNLGAATGEFESGEYGWSAFHASLGAMDIYSAGASGYSAGRDISSGSRGLANELRIAEQKIIGSAQETGTRGHSTVTKLVAKMYALNPSVERVTMDNGYRKLTGVGRYGPRPDVGVLYKSGKVRVVEVASKTDDISTLIRRNELFAGRYSIDATIKVNRWAQRINKIFPK